MRLCNYRDAVDYIISKGLAKKQNPYSGSDSDREENPEVELQPVTLSVIKLCRNLKKMNHKFSFNFINETEIYDEECVDKAEDAELTPVKI